MTSLYLKISRPRFWFYLLGPFLLGVAAAPGAAFPWRLPLLGLFFTYPANLLIYGFNDLFDYDTDRHNPKKKGYEVLLAPDRRGPLLRQLTLAGLFGMLLVLPAAVPSTAKWAMTGFYFFGLGYSVPPLRAKTKPLLDSLFNVLYVFPALVSFGLLSGRYPPPALFFAAMLWCMAMHAYSAVPDIAADKKAGLATVATWLGERATLLFCLVCYLGAALLAFKWLGVFSIFGAGVYSALIAASLANPERDHVFRLYRYFPYVNVGVGMALFFWIALVVK